MKQPFLARLALLSAASVGLLWQSQWFEGERFWLMRDRAGDLRGSVIYYIYHARTGKPLNVRKIAGLAAVDEAVGRATEMGRPVLFIPGIQDMNDIQTIAGITCCRACRRRRRSTTPRSRCPRRGRW
jgi:hypothetical protein